MRGPVAALAALLVIGLAVPAYADRRDDTDDDDDADARGSDHAEAAPTPSSSDHPHHALDSAVTHPSDEQIDEARFKAVGGDYQHHLPRDGYAEVGDDDLAPLDNLPPQRVHTPFDDDDDTSYDHGHPSKDYHPYHPFGQQGSGSDAGGSGSDGNTVPPFGRHDPNGSGGSDAAGSDAGGSANGSGGGSGSAGTHSRTATPTDTRFGGRHRAGNGNLPDDREDPDDPQARRHYRYEGDDEREEHGSFMSWIMWGAVIVGIMLVLFWISNELLKGDGEAEIAPSKARDDTSAIVDAVIERPLGDADEFAHHGDYAEAIHTLLLRTLHELARSAAVRVAPANTSREILAKVPLLADARDALAGLITTVELTHFGDEPANAADYERCVRQFQVFAAAFRGALAAPRGAAA